MTWAEIGKKVASVAPVLSGVLGGPVGAVAGAAGALLGSFLGVDPEPEKIAAALNPETLVRLKELEVRQQDRLLEWQSAQLKCEVEDMVSARSREVELAKAGHGASWATSLVAVIVTVGFFVMLGILLKGGRNDLGDAGLILMGALGAAFTQVVHYYLGSSSGSTAKSFQLAELKRAVLGAQ